jgi:pullulanase/glycogen debranching enzyme
VVAPAGGLSIVDNELRGNFYTVPMRAGLLSEKHRKAFPHLWAYNEFTLSPANVKEALRGQLVVTERAHDGELLSATGVQIGGVLDDVYADAARARLGAQISGNRAALALWAPTAKAVSVEINGGATPMKRDDATGVWRAEGPWVGKNYLYRIQHYDRTVTATDPYSVALTPNSTHSVVAPLGTEKPLPFNGRPQIQELSVRDFSIADTTVPAKLRGTYGAFTVASDGTDHLRARAAAGVTHLHLLPTFDFGTVPEVRSDQAVPGHPGVT